MQFIAVVKTIHIIYASEFKGYSTYLLTTVSYNQLLFAPNVTFNCLYLNINNVPIKVNHLHICNETCPTAIKRSFLSIFSFTFRDLLSLCSWKHHRRVGEIWKNTSHSNKNFMKLSIISYTKKCYYSHVFLRSTWLSLH